jgi:hypothetical protein
MNYSTGCFIGYMMNLYSLILIIFSVHLMRIILIFLFPGDQLAIGKETGRRLGMGTNMYPSSALLGQNKDESIAALPVDDLIEKADGFAGVFPGMFQFNSR